MTLLFLFILYALALSAALARAGFRSRTAQPDGTPVQSLSRVLVVGATGGTGRQLVSQALELGLAVTALARDPSRLKLSHPNLIIIQGDVFDYASVEAAMRGQQAVLSALGHKQFLYPTRILSEGTQNILRAMQANSVPRIICLTSLGLGDSAGHMGLYYTFFVIPLILPFYFWDKTRQERLIAESEVEWVIVRAGALTNGKTRGGCRHGWNISSYLWTVRIPRADVAAFMIDQLTSNQYLRSAPGVCQ